MFRLEAAVYSGWRNQTEYALDRIVLKGYGAHESWTVEYTDEFEAWWNGLAEEEQDSVAVAVEQLELYGPSLRYPYSSGITASRHGHMRELRIQHAGDPYRVLYAFDPRRIAVLLTGGNKTGDNRWYEGAIRDADRLYVEHLEALKQEGEI